METENKKKNPVTAYFATAYAELRKVTWPTRSEAWQKTQVVIVFSLVFAIFLGSVDYLLSGIIQLLLQ